MNKTDLRIHPRKSLAAKFPPKFTCCFVKALHPVLEQVLVASIIHTRSGTGRVDVRNPAPVEVGRLCHYLQGFIRPSWCRISCINNTFARDFQCVYGVVFLEGEFYTFDEQQLLRMRKLERNAPLLMKREPELERPGRTPAEDRQGSLKDGAARPLGL